MLAMVGVFGAMLVCYLPLPYRFWYGHRVAPGADSVKKRGGRPESKKSASDLVATRALQSQIVRLTSDQVVFSAVRWRVGFQTASFARRASPVNVVLVVVST